MQHTKTVFFGSLKLLSHFKQKNYVFLNFRYSDVKNRIFKVKPKLV